MSNKLITSWKLKFTKWISLRIRNFLETCSLNLPRLHGKDVFHDVCYLFRIEDTVRLDEAVNRI